jgi:hypothetical protein
MNKWLPYYWILEYREVTNRWSWSWSIDIKCCVFDKLLLCVNCTTVLRGVEESNVEAIPITAQVIWEDKILMVIVHGMRWWVRWIWHTESVMSTEEEGWFPVGNGGGINWERFPRREAIYLNRILRDGSILWEERIILGTRKKMHRCSKLEACTIK